MTAQSPAAALRTIIPPRRAQTDDDRHPLLRLYARFTPSQGWSAFIILLGALMSVSLSLQDGGWVPMPGISYVLIWAAIAGLAIAKLRVHWAAMFALFPLGLILGAVLVVWQAASEADAPALADALAEIQARASVWYEAATSDGISTDLLPFTLILLSLAWIIGYASSFFLFRASNAWAAVVLGGVAILTNLSFLPPSLNYSSKFFIFTLFAMLLIVRVSVAQSEASWRRRGIRFDMVNGWLTMHAAIWFGLCVMFVAAALPMRVYVSQELASAWNAARAPVANLEEEVERLLAGVQARRDAPGRFFGKTLPFIGAISFDGDVVFWANSEYPSYWLSNTYSEYTPQGWKAGETTKIEVGPETAPPPRPDWRGRKSVDQSVQLDFDADAFLAGGSLDWLSHSAVAETLLPKQFVIQMRPPDDDAAAADADLPPDIQRLAEALRGAGEAPPQRFAESYISRLLPSDIALNTIAFAPDAESGALAMESVTIERKASASTEIVSWKFTERLQENHPYTMVSYVSVATDDDLRQAPTDYDAFITDHYLQLPPNLPQRVMDKAAELTQNADNPFDKATAVSDYLRGEAFTYSQDIDAPPRGADGVDYFLFETKTGYSDYFASSMVVLMRAAGVPARLAAGYAPGEYDAEYGVRVVRDYDSHGWAQVFFPEYGWIDFEPTPRWPAHERRFTDIPGAGLASSGGDTEFSGDTEEFLDPFGEIGIPGMGTFGGGDAGGAAFSIDALLPIARWTGIAAGCAAALWLLLYWIWNIGLRGLTPVERAYAKMNRLGTVAGLRRSADQTPREYAAHIAASLDSAAAAASAAAARIAAAYAAARYARPAATAPDSVVVGDSGGWGNADAPAVAPAPAADSAIGSVDADSASEDSASQSSAAAETSPNAAAAAAMERDWRALRGALISRALRRLLPGGNNVA